MTPSRREAAVAAYPGPGQIICGEFVAAGSRELREVFDPARCQPLGSYPMCTEDDIARALKGAARAFEVWRKTPADERAVILSRVAMLMRERADSLADLITLELGKPRAEALAEIEQAAGLWQWAAEEGRRAYGRLIPPRADGGRHMVSYEPIGPVAAFGSWNAPFITPSRKISGALAAGCTVVIKGAEEVAACSLAVASLVCEAGVPEGAVSMLFGDPALISQRLLEAPEIRAMTFTGSTAIGTRLASIAIGRMVRPILELGGHAPVLVFDDVDVEATAKAAVAAKFRNSGQVCTSPTRFLVARPIYRDFLDLVTANAQKLVVGDGFEATTQMGPLISPRRIAAIDALVADARERGKPILAGGEQLDRPGWFYSPTVIADVDSQTRVAFEEPFGPIAALRPFDSYEEAIGLANALPQALASYVHTRDMSLALRAVDDIQAGSVICNGWRVSLPETPFGGVKESGLFQEGGIEGIRAFQNVKYAHLR